MPEDNLIQYWKYLPKQDLGKKKKKDIKATHIGKKEVKIFAKSF